MNSKNLSKAINRMLAILLTAAMVAGSFTVPVKADEPAVVESITDDAAGTSDGVAEDVVKETPEPVVENNTSTGEETSEEAEEALPAEEEQPAAAEKTTEEAEAVVNADGSASNVRVEFDYTGKVYDAKAVTTSELGALVKVYDAASGEALSTASLGATYAFEEKTTAGWGAAETIKNANDYRMIVTLTYDGEETVKIFPFKITKLDIKNWELGKTGNGMGTFTPVFRTSYTSGDGANTNASSKPVYTIRNNVAVPVMVDALDNITYAKPIGSKKNDAIVEDFFSAVNINKIRPGTESTETTLHGADTVEANDLVNATKHDSTEGAAEDRPYVQFNVNGLTNYTGTFKAYFEIAKATSGLELNSDASLRKIYYTIPETETGSYIAHEDELPLYGLVKQTNLTEKVNGVDVKKDVIIEDIKWTGYTNPNNFFKSKISDDNTTTADFSVTGKGTKDMTFGYKIIKNASATEELDSEITVVTRNYGDFTLPLEFRTILGKNTSVAANTLDVNATSADLKYTGDPAQLALTFKDSGGQETESTNWSTNATYNYSGYFYSVEKNGEGTVISKELVGVVDGNKDNNSINTDGEITLSAPDGKCIDVGDYSVTIVYNNSAGTASSFTKLIDFTISAETSTGMWACLTDSPTAGGLDNTGEIGLKADGKGGSKANLTKDDLKVTVVTNGGAKVLTADDYTITEMNPSHNGDVITLGENNGVTGNTKLAALKATEEFENLDALSTAYNNATNDTYKSLFVENGTRKAYVYNSSGVSGTKAIFKDQPYVKISLTDKGKERYGNVEDIYFAYAIKPGEATADPTDRTIIVPSKTQNVTVDLTGLFTTKVPGETPTAVDAAQYMDKYTITADAGSNKIATSLSSLTSKSSISLKLVQNIAAGSTITLSFAPVFTGGRYAVTGSKTIDIKFKDDAEISAEFGGDLAALKTKPEIAYSGSALTLDGTTVISKVTAGETVVDNNGSGHFTYKLYQLASEVNNPDAVDQVPPLADGGTARCTYDKKVYTSKKATLVDGKIDTLADINNTDAENAGNYLLVVSWNSTGKTACPNYNIADADNKVELPFEITPIDISSGYTVTLTDYNGSSSTGDGKVNYNSDDYKKLVAKDSNLTPVSSITGAVSVASTDYTVEIDGLTAPATATGKYTIPITIKGKAPNFIGKITDKKFEVQPVSIGTVAFTLKKSSYDYTGEEITPEIKLITVNGNRFETIEDLKAAYEKLEVSFEAATSGSSTIVSSTANDKTATLTLGGVYNDSATQKWTINKADNTDINVGTDPIEVTIKDNASNASNKVGYLPKKFASATEGVDDYEVTGYDVSGITNPVSIKSGTGAATLGSITVNDYMLSVTPNTTLVKDDVYEFTVKAEFENYKSKDVKIKLVVKDNAADTTIVSKPTWGASNAKDYNALNAEQRIAASTGTEALKIKQGDRTYVYGDTLDGTLKFTWYKSVNNGTYTECTVEDTANVDAASGVCYYKAVITLEGASTHYMTPVETNILQVKKITIDDTTKRDGDIIVSDAGLVYDGTVQSPTVTINLKADALYSGSPAYTLKKGTDFTVGSGGEVNANTYTIAATSGLTAGNIGGNVLKPTANKTWKISKREITLDLEDKTVALGDTTEVLSYATLKKDGDVPGLVEGQEVVDEKVALKAVDSSNNAVALTEICKKAGTYTVMVDDELDNDAIKVSGTGGTSTGSNYKLARASKNATITVKEPETIPVTAEVKVGDTVVTNGKKIVKTDETRDVTAVVTNTKTGKALIYTDYRLVVKDKSGTIVPSVYGLGKYTITIESANNAFIFEPVEIEIEVVDSIPYDVKSVEVSPASITLKKSGATGTINYSVYGLYEGTSATELVDEPISIKPATSENFSITDNHDGTITVTALTDKKGITEKFEVSVVSAPDVKPATFTLKTTPSEPGAGEASSETPDDDEEYTTITNTTELKRRDFADSKVKGQIAKLSKTAYTYNGKHCEPVPTVTVLNAEGRTIKLTKDQDYRVRYEDNVNRGIATVIVYGINDYMGTIEYRFTINPKKANFKLFAGDAYCDESSGELCKAEDIIAAVYDGTATALEPAEDAESEEGDYVASIAINTKKNKPEITLTGINNYTGSKTFTVPFTDMKNKEGYIAEVTLKDDIYEYEYTGKKIVPEYEVVVKNTKNEVITSADYKATYKNNVNKGIGYLEIKGTKKIAGKILVPFTITAASGDDGKENKITNVSLAKTSVVYNGKLQKPKVTVMDPTNDRKKLTLNKDYIVEYYNNLNVGTAYVEITGINNYDGQVLSGYDNDKLTFQITPLDIKKAKVTVSNKLVTAVTYNKRTLEHGKDYYAVLKDAKSGYELTIYGYYNYEVGPDDEANISNFTTPSDRNGNAKPLVKKIKNKSDIAATFEYKDLTAKTP